MSTRCPAPVTSISSAPPPPRPELMLYTSRPTSFLAGLGMWHVALCEEGEARPARASGRRESRGTGRRSGLALKGRFCLWRARAVPPPVTHRPPSQLSAWQPGSLLSSLLPRWGLVPEKGGGCAVAPTASVRAGHPSAQPPASSPRVQELGFRHA